MPITITKRNPAPVSPPAPESVAAQVSGAIVRVVGVDVSTKTGVVVFEGDDKLPLYVGEIDVEKSKGPTPQMTRIFRMRDLTKAFRDVVSKYSPKFVLVEGYALGQANTQVLAMLAELGAVVRMSAYVYNVPTILEVSPTTLKKFALNVGVGKKEDVKLGVYKKWGFEHVSNNIVDAYVLAQIARGVAGIIAPRNQAEREVIATVEKQPES